MARSSIPALVAIVGAGAALGCGGDDTGGGGAGGATVSGSSSSASSSSSVTSASVSSSAETSSSSTGVVDMCDGPADGVCDPLNEDCNCSDCTRSALCNPGQCIDDGVCDHVNDSCTCADCDSDYYCADPGK